MDDASWNWTLGVNLMSVIWGSRFLAGQSKRTAREDRSFRLPPSLDWLGEQVLRTMWRCGAVRGTPCDTCAAGDRGVCSVSWLYPHAIMNSRRNVPQRFVGAIEGSPPEGPVAELVQAVK